MKSAIYQGTLTHVRRGPSRHRFTYRIHMLYLDLDEVERVLPVGPLRRGHFGWLSFCRADYLGDARQALRTEVLDRVEAQLGRRPSGPVRLLTHVRCFGYVFNPVSFYYCFGADGVTLEALVAEITNTPWGERHAYVLATEPGGVHATFPKVFHVSPFFGMAQQYTWVLTRPADRLSVTMVTREDGRDVFSASLALARRSLTRGMLWRVMAAQPLMTWRVHLGIYMQALALRRKRTPYFDHPAPPGASTERSTAAWKA